MKAINSLKLIVASFCLFVLSLPAFAQIQTAGELLVDLNVSRGTNIAGGQNTNLPAEISMVAWTNYGILGGQFDDASNSLWAANILANSGNAYSNAPFMTNVLGTNAPATFGGTRLMVASFPTPPQLQGTTSFSVECWFYETSIPAEPRGLFGWTLEAPPSGDSGELSGSASAAYHADAKTLNWNTNGTNISLLVWHHGVITYDGSSNQIAYLDGVPVNTNHVSLTFNSFNAAGTTNAHPAIFSGLNNIPITGTVGSGARAAMAALRVHSDALSAAQVAANFAAGAVATPPASNLVVEIDPVSGPQSGTPQLNANLIATGDANTTTTVFMYDTVDHGRTTNGWAHYVVHQTGFQFTGAYGSVIPTPANSTLYYVRSYATNSGDTNISAPVTFLSQGPPVINNTGATFNGPGSDLLSANLVTAGSSTFPGTSVTVFWGPTDGGSNPAAWANSNQFVPNSATTGPLSYAVTGLLALTNQYYTMMASNSYGTVWATPSVAFQEGAIFTLNTANLPAASLPPAALTPVTNWQSTAGTFTTFSGAPKVHDFGGVQYLSLTGSQSDGMLLPVASFPGGIPPNLAINGASLVMVIEPTALPAAPGNVGGITVASVYDTQFGMGMGGTIQATIAGGSVSNVTITSGGSNYTSPPTVTFQAPGGMSVNTTATGTAQISGAGKVTNVIITSGGSGYAWQRTAQVLNVLPPTVTFSGGGGSGAAATAVMNTTNGYQLEAIVNQNRPTDTADLGAGGNGYNWASAAFGRPTANDVYIPQNAISVVSLVAGSGLTGYGQPTPGGAGDNNYLVYVNGVLVEDTAAGFVRSLGLAATNVGSGYLPHGGNIPLTFNTPPGGTAATAFMTVSNNALGSIASVTLTYGGSGYTAANPPSFTVPAPTDGSVPNTNAVITTNVQSLGNYESVQAGGVPSLLGATNIGWNHAGMTTLNYNIPHGTYGSGTANSTFGIGDQAGTGEVGLTGYLGDISFWGEALTPAVRQSLENAAAAKFITGATLSFSITESISGAAGSVTFTGPSSVVQGYSATINVTPASGYAVTAVTINGSSVAVAGSYTLVNVSAAQNIVATTVQAPPQQITVTYGAGGAISTNGTVVPDNTVYSVVGGSSQTYTLVPAPGYLVSTFTVDGNSVAIAPTYVFANIGIPLAGGTNHTVNATFATLPVTPVSAHVPESDNLFFSVDTSSLPQTPGGGAPITNWPMFYSDQGSNQMFLGTTYYGNATGVANTAQDVSGVIWESNSSSSNTFYQFYSGYSTTAFNIPNTGATIMTVVSPTITSASTQPWAPVVDVFFNCFELSVLPDSGLIQAMVDNDEGAFDGTASPRATSTYAIPNGTNAVLTLVAQPNGNFTVYANTVMVITNAGLGNLVLRSYYQGYRFASQIMLGNDGPDGGANFNGLIGDTYFWTTALTTTERTNLEAALMSQFHAVVPPNFNWVGGANANWSAVTSWSNTVPLASNTVPGLPGVHGVPVFSLSGAGSPVQLDVSGINVNGLTFNTNATIAGANTLTLDSGTAANPIITVATNEAATISAALSTIEGLNVVGGGSLTLSGGATLTGALDIAPTAASSATVSINGGTVSTITSVPTNRSPGVMLGGRDDTATTAILNLNTGGTLSAPSIGCVTETGGLLVPPSNFGATGILNFNGGVFAPSDSDSANVGAVADGTDHIIFNTSHTFISAGGATIAMSGGFIDSINTPLEHSGGSVQDGGLTVKGQSGFLTLLQGATYTGPTSVGITEFPADNVTVAFAQSNSMGGNVLNIISPCTAELDYTGTSPVYQLNIDGVSQATGTWGSGSSGAAHVDSHFTGNGTVTVIGTNGITAPHITSTAITGSGAFVTLGGTGGKAGGVYTVLGSTTANAPLNTWTTVAQGIFTAGPAFSISIPYTNGVPAVFYDVVVP